MLELPTVTLFCADCNCASRAQQAITAIEKCRAVCNFGAIKFLTDAETDYPYKVAIPSLRSQIAYSIFMLKRAHTYIDTSHMLTVQHDGWIINADAWNPEWLNYDYIGPLFRQDLVVTDKSVGSGGFSFRSKALMQYIDEMLPPWDGSDDCDSYQRQLGYYEDGTIAIVHRDELVEAGFTFAPPEEACKFAQGGNPNPRYYVPKPFGVHLWQNWRGDLDNGKVDPV